MSVNSIIIPSLKQTILKMYEYKLASKSVSFFSFHKIARAGFFPLTTDQARYNECVDRETNKSQQHAKFNQN